MNAERNYDGLLTAASVVFGFSVIVCIASAIAAFYWVSVERVETAITSVGLGVGLLINGVIIRGLVRLAVNVANDVHGELSSLNEKTAVNTRLLASLANAADPTPVTVAGVVAQPTTTVTINANLTQADTIPAPTVLPSLGKVSGGIDVNVPAKTYYVVFTWSGPVGESAPSREASLAITGGLYGTTTELLTVTVPSPPAGVTNWNLYVGLAPGEEQLQAILPATSSNAILTWTQNGDISQGAPPPTLATAG